MCVTTPNNVNKSQKRKTSILTVNVVILHHIFIMHINHYDDTKKTRGNNVNVQLNGACTRHRKVFPEERTHTYTDDQLTAPILTHTTEPTEC